MGAERWKAIFGEAGELQGGLNDGKRKLLAAGADGILEQGIQNENEYVRERREWGERQEKQRRQGWVNSARQEIREEETKREMVGGAEEISRGKMLQPKTIGLGDLCQPRQISRGRSRRWRIFKESRTRVFHR